LKPLQDVTGTFRWIPAHITISPYLQMWQTVPLGRYFVKLADRVHQRRRVVGSRSRRLPLKRSARYRFRGRRCSRWRAVHPDVPWDLVSAPAVPDLRVSIGNATGITLLGSRTGLVITYLTFSLPFSIWLLAGYFDSIPRSLDEAAQVDGGGPLRALLRVDNPGGHTWHRHRSDLRVHDGVE